MKSNRKSSDNIKNGWYNIVNILLVFWLLGSIFCATWYSKDSTSITSAIEKLNQQVTTRRSQLENLKNKLATSKSQENIMAQVKKYNLGLSVSSRGQIKQISASMVSNSRFNTNTTVVAFSE